jgi:hypothetical protein
MTNADEQCFQRRNRHVSGNPSQEREQNDEPTIKKREARGQQGGSV